MDTMHVSSKKGINLVSVLLLLPAAWVIMTGILKYGMGVSGPFDVSAPLLERLGIKESPGLNISMLIVLGPVLAVLISLWQLLRIKWEISPEQARFHVTIFKKWLPLVIACCGGLILLLLAVYLAGENCNCH